MIDIKGVHAVMLSDKDHDVMNTSSAHIKVGHKKWLSDDKSVSHKSADFAKAGNIYVCRCQNSLLIVKTFAGGVTLPFKNPVECAGKSRCGSGCGSWSLPWSWRRRSRNRCAGDSSTSCQKQTHNREYC